MRRTEELTVDIFVESVNSAIMLKTKVVGVGHECNFMEQCCLVSIPFNPTNVPIY